MNVSGFHFDTRITDLEEGGYDFVTELEVRGVVVGYMYVCIT